MPERVSYATNLEKVGISAFHEVPAVENVSGTLTGTLAGGQLDASAQDFMLHLAKVFPEPWRYREARTRMFWSLDDRAFTNERDKGVRGVPVKYIENRRCSGLGWRTPRAARPPCRI